MQYEIQRCTRHCFVSGRELAPGEAFYSVLVAEGAQLHRYDYAADAWKGPPTDAVGWWKSQVPDRNANRRHWAPNDVMLRFFDELADQHGLEKIKTIGDKYMVAGGLPTPQADHAEAVAEMALDIRNQVALFNKENDRSFRMRIGINTGSVVAGVIGVKK